MIRDLSINKVLEKHSRHVESAHRELKLHLAELIKNPTAGELHRLLHYQIRPRLSRLQEIKNCPKRGPAFKAKFPEHHAHCEEAEPTYQKLIDLIHPILSKYFIPGSEEIDAGRELDPEDKKTLVAALNSELEN